MRKIQNIKPSFTPRKLGKEGKKPPKLAEGNKPQKSEQKKLNRTLKKIVNIIKLKTSYLRRQN